MKKFLLTLLVIIAAAGVLGGAGWAGYRYGYNRGVGATSNGKDILKPFENQMPMHNFEQGNGSGFHHHDMEPRGDFGMMRHGRGFGFFSPFAFLGRLAVFAFIIWLGYKLFTGWRITFTQPNPKPTEPEQKNN